MARKTKTTTSRRTAMPSCRRLAAPSCACTASVTAIAFSLPSTATTRPVHVLIDCGYKPGSPAFIKAKSTDPDDVVADIKAVTGGHIDVAVITHEHQDHVNAITKKRFAGVTIGETWLAWTESEDDKLAKLLRKNHNDRLKALALASIDWGPAPTSGTKPSPRGSIRSWRSKSAGNDPWRGRRTRSPPPARGPTRMR